MPKFYGKIGFAETTETSPGVFVESIVDREYYGDVLDFARRLQSSDKVNDNIEITNQLSIVADQNAYNHINEMRYAEFMGVKWKITSVKVLYPRLQLTLGDEWNGPTATTS